jgi:hypothetical protein
LHQYVIQLEEKMQEITTSIKPGLTLSPLYERWSGNAETCQHAGSTFDTGGFQMLPIDMRNL